MGQLSPTEPDQITDLSEQMEWEIMCDIHALNPAPGYPRCPGHKAEWIAWRSAPCGCPPGYRLVCTDCKEVYQQWMTEHQTRAITCGMCDAETGGFSKFEPLRKL